MKMFAQRTPLWQVTVPLSAPGSGLLSAVRVAVLLTTQALPLSLTERQGPCTYCVGQSATVHARQVLMKCRSGSTKHLHLRLQGLTKIFVEQVPPWQVM